MMNLKPVNPHRLAAPFSPRSAVGLPVPSFPSDKHLHDDARKRDAATIDPITLEAFDLPRLRAARLADAADR